MAVHQAFADYHHPELLDNLERAIDIDLGRLTVGEALTSLEGEDRGGLPGLDDRILHALTGHTTPAPPSGGAPQASGPGPGLTGGDRAGGSEIG